MARQEEYGFGMPRKTEWPGLWKAQASDSDVTLAELEQARDSLHRWLSQLYLTDWRYGARRHCWVESQGATDRTLQVTIVVPSLLDQSLVQLAQRWLASGYGDWRIAIPTGGPDQPLILIYEQGIRISSDAEADLESYLRRSRERLQQWINLSRPQFQTPVAHSRAPSSVA